MEYKYQQSQLKKQRGVVVVILAAGMAALLAVAGLALDSGNLFLNKSKLQNAADASALSAGVALNASGGNYQKAVDSATARFASVIATEGNEKLQTAFNSGQISLAVTTSPTLSPFVGSNADDDWYVRVAVSALPLDSFFLRVIGIDTLDVPASAVAGRTPVGVSDPTGGAADNLICDVAPMMVCMEPGSTADSNWGYELGETQILKATSKCQAITGDGTCVKPATADDWSVDVGNFQLIQLSDADGPLSGGAGVREAMAGGVSCITSGNDSQITTEPGNVVGPVVQGLNTRFGIYNGPLAGASADYPSDSVPGSPRGEEMTYDTYKGIYADKTTCANSCDDEGEDYRRMLNVPIGDCSTSESVKGETELKGLGCFFVTKKATQKGNESAVYGQFVDGCKAGTTALPGDGPVYGDDSTSTPGGNSINKAYIIQLYKNPGSRDS
jgi:Flp pilus assembly protein TadG